MEDLETRDPPLRIAAQVLRPATLFPRFRHRAAAAVALLAVLLPLALAAGPAGQTPPTPVPLTLLSRDGRKLLAVNLISEQEFVALDDLAAAFQLAVQEDSLGAITVSYKGKTIVL